MDTNPDSLTLSRKKSTPWITPTRFLFALLAIEVILFASEEYQWFAFNRNKNWTVLICVAVTVSGLLLMVCWLGAGLLLRRLVQFDLVALFLLISAWAISCAWFVEARNQVERERLAIAWIKARDGGKHYETYDGTSEHIRAGSFWSGMTSHCGPIRRRSRFRKWLGDAFFDKNLRIVEVGDRFPEDQNATQHFGVFFESKYDVSNTELVYLSRFRELEQLGICSRKVTDAGLRSLHGLRRLKKLRLVTPNVTPEGIADLRGHLPNCEIVQYEDTVVPVDMVENG